VRAKRNLIIIPGLGDRRWYYGAFALIWRCFGFSTSVYVFGWNDELASLEEKNDPFLKTIASYKDEGVSIIGVSAGGSAAINALIAYPDIVRAVITVSSPLHRFPSLRHKLLRQSVNKTEVGMDAAEEAVLRRILSVYGISDQTVPISNSQDVRVHKKQLPSHGHAQSIATALVLHVDALRQFIISKS